MIACKEKSQKLEKNLKMMIKQIGRKVLKSDPSDVNQRKIFATIFVDQFFLSLSILFISIPHFF
jgi:hypothetical protein